MEPGSIVPAQFKKCTIDSRGDLWICAGAESGPPVSLLSDIESPTWAFRVCSRALARCSPVFSDMFFDSNGCPRSLQYFHESMIHLSAHQAPDVSALHVFLRLTHGLHCGHIETDKLLDGLSDEDRLARTYELTRLTNTYACTEVLNFVAEAVRKWLDSYMKVVDLCRLYKSIWISWEFGHWESFRHFMGYLVSCYSASEDTPEERDGASFGAQKIPGLLDFVQTQRAVLVNKYYDIVIENPGIKAVLDGSAYFSSSGSQGWCVVGTTCVERGQCHEYLYARVMSALCKGDMLPLVRDKKVSCINADSLRELVWLLPANQHIITEHNSCMRLLQGSASIEKGCRLEDSFDEYLEAFGKDHFPKRWVVSHPSP